MDVILQKYIIVRYLYLKKNQTYIRKIFSTAALRLYAFACLLLPSVLALLDTRLAGIKK